MNTTITKPITRNVTVRANPDDIIVVKLLASGRTVPEVSKKTAINQRTLEKKILILKKAYNAKTIAELVAFFIRNNLIR